jgi:hypothetical protein
MRNSGALGAVGALPPPNIDVKPLRKPPPLLLLEDEEAAVSEAPGRENHEDEAAGAAVVAEGIEEAGAMGSKADPLFNLKAGSLLSRRILMVSDTGVGCTLKLTEVSSRLTNSTPSEQLEAPIPEAEGGVPASFRWLPRSPISKSSMFVISVAPKSFEESPPM